MQRLRIILEFSKNKPEDLELYGKLLRLSSPAAIIKDILKGVLPLSTINTIKEEWWKKRGGQCTYTGNLLILFR